MSSIGRVPLVLLLGLASPVLGQGTGVQLNIPIVNRSPRPLPLGASVNAVIPLTQPARGPAVVSGGTTNVLRNVFNVSNQAYNPYLMGGLGGYGGDFGMLGAGAGVGYGTSLQGLGQYTLSAAGYERDIQTARLGQESVRQANIDSARRRIEFEMWYDKMRPTTQKMLDAESRVELDRARRVPTASDVESGRMLNTLLKHVQKGKLSRGPNIPIDPEVLKRINLNGGSSGGNVGLLKVIDKVVWPEALREEAYEEPRKRLVENMKKAITAMKNGEMPSAQLRKDLRADHQALATKLDESVNDLPLSLHTEALRFLRQVNSAITAMSDPKVVNYYNNNWAAKGRNVAELVDHMTQQGLTFSESTEGDEAAYQALYEALRSFDNGMQDS